MTIKSVFGGGSIGSYFKTDDEIAKIFAILKREGVDVIDTARLYSGSEELIGKAPSHSDFTIDTKLLGGFGGDRPLTKTNIIEDIEDSLQKVQIKQFDIVYIHAPEPSVPFSETVEGINDAYKKGYFRRFGISNFSAEQVQEIYDAAKSKGFVLPSVYQGNYNPVGRKVEAELFPTLRALNFAFYAYSPLAGGFLTKTLQQLDDGMGRFNAQVLGGIYKKMYDKPSFRKALEQWNDIAKKEGVSKAELAYRWVAYNSELKEELGDAVIFGASKLEQVEQTAQTLKKGPLSEEAAGRIDELWKLVEGDALMDNYQAILS